MHTMSESEHVDDGHTEWGGFPDAWTAHDSARPDYEFGRDDEFTHADPAAGRSAAGGDWDRPTSQHKHAPGSVYGLVPPEGAHSEPKRKKGRGFGGFAAIAGLAGGGMVALSFLLLDWLSVDPSHTKFKDLHTVAAHATGDTFSKYYFSWVAWVGLGIIVGLTLMSSIPAASHWLTRPLAIITGIAGAGITVLAVQELPGGTWTHVYQDSIVGVWCAVAGCLVCACGAFVGPRRRS